MRYMFWSNTGGPVSFEIPFQIRESGKFLLTFPSGLRLLSVESGINEVSKLAEVEVS
jgi:hypothetical protein